MTITRANEIVDGIESVLASPRHVGGNFTPLSRTGAASRAELAHAVYIVTAQVFQAVRRRINTTDGRESEFASFAQSAGAGLAHVLMLCPCLPDSELRLIGTLSDETEEFCFERARLQALAMNDDAKQLETIDSFVSFLQTLNPSGVNYWPLVYERIRVPLPADD